MLTVGLRQFREWISWGQATCIREKGLLLEVERVHDPPEVGKAHVTSLTESPIQI